MAITKRSNLLTIHARATCEEPKRTHACMRCEVVNTNALPPGGRYGNGKATPPAPTVRRANRPCTSSHGVDMLISLAYRNSGARATAVTGQASVSGAMAAERIYVCEKDVKL